MAGTTQRRAKLAPEDAQRMQRLYEEVTGRLREMALIVGRTTGAQMGADVTPKFAPARRAQVFPQPPGPPVDVDIEIFDLPDGTSCCYDYIHQECACPC